MRISDWSSECALPISSLEGMDVLLNASPLGMTGKPPLALSPAAMNRNAIIFDMVYAPLETPLLRQSRSLGFEAVDGLQMLVAQAAGARSEEHTSELQSLMRISYAVFCLKKKNQQAY